MRGCCLQRGLCKRHPFPFLTNRRANREHQYRSMNFIVGSTKAETVMVRTFAAYAVCALMVDKLGVILSLITARRPILGNIFFTPPCSTARFKSFLSCYVWIIDQNSICQSVSIELKSVETLASKPIVWFVMPTAMTKFWVPISTSMINPIRPLLFCWVVVVAQLNRLNRTAWPPRPSLGNGRRRL